ncbi:MAG TPA: hypothetical protein VFW66_00895 [Gemmatimonadales bacterium]|nr:hypothetical protein [Gemmatimonadales bacterium]
MSGDATKVQEALGNLALLGDHPIKQSSPKIDPPTLEGLDDVTAFLVTYVLDLQRRMEYLFLATAEFGAYGSPELAADLKRDYDRLNEGTLEAVSWQERAARAQEALLAAHRRAGPAHERLLGDLAGRAKGGVPPATGPAR